MHTLQMSNYLRWYRPGATYFFTVVTHLRQQILCTDSARRCLRQAIADCRTMMPFSMPAVVLLPHHLHAVWVLPDGDADFSKRWGLIKQVFTRQYLSSGGETLPVSQARDCRRERGVWQKRFWEHLIRDQKDLIQHVDYIHYNPVKHGFAQCPHAWPWSSFHDWCKQGMYAADWRCDCREQNRPAPVFDLVDNRGDV